jgi:hypothetical protein
MERDMAAINALLSQELQARCRYKKDGTTVEFTATLPYSADLSGKEQNLQKKIDSIMKTTYIADEDLPGG